MTDLISRLHRYGKELEVCNEAAKELRRLHDALATESSRKCATEHDCVWQPHCAHAGKCMRPERPYGAALKEPT